MLRWCQLPVRVLDRSATPSIGIRHYARKPVGSTSIFSSSASRPPICAHTHSNILKRCCNTRPSHLARSAVSAPRSLSTNKLDACNIEPVPPSELAKPAACFSSLETVSDELSASTLSEILSSRDSPSVNVLVVLYTRAKRQDMLSCLSSVQFTELLGICGTHLLADEGRVHSVYHSQRMLQDQGSRGAEGEAVHWKFMLKVLGDKELLGYDLEEVDRYWMMLALLKTVAHGSALTASTREVLSLANIQYLKIRHQPHSEIHMPYFRTFLSMNREWSITALKHLSHLLKLHPGAASNYSSLFWQATAQRGHDLPLQLKAEILDMVFTRATSPPSNVTRSSPLRMSSDPKGNHLKTYSVSQLGSILSSVVFPGYSPEFSPISLKQWAVKQVKEAFAPSLPVDARWDNLLLLSVSRLLRESSLASGLSLNSAWRTKNTVWSTILMLAVLEQTFSVMKLDVLLRNEVQGISRPLWRVWKKIDISRTPIDVTRSVVAGFFRIAALSIDKPLTDGCFRYCKERSLWTDRTGEESVMTAQTAYVIAAYVMASASCRGRDWSGIFSSISSAFTGTQWRDQVVTELITLYASQDVETGANLVSFSQTNGIYPSISAVRVLSLALIATQEWDLLVPFLWEPRFPRAHIEHLLVSILRVFQTQRRELADVSLVEVLGKCMLKLYAHLPPAPTSRYPIRYFFSVMVATRYGAVAVDIIEAIHHSSPGFFTMRVFTRLARQLVAHGEPSVALRLLRLAESGAASRPLDDMRRKLTMSLHNSGAHNLARKTSHRITRRTRRDMLIRAVHFRRIPTDRFNKLHIIPIATAVPEDGPTIRHAVSLLVNANRPHAARKLFARTFHKLDSKVCTVIGNIILHGPSRSLEERNGRLVRQTLRIKDFLMHHYGFVPDRATLNIILKTLFKWRTGIDSQKLKRLFDQVIRQGYPASVKWHQRHGVPFGTPPSSPVLLSFPSLTSHISFEKHVRPMYKMFIKAFYLRNDVHAAKKVVGILKEEEVIALKEREKRNAARRMGIIKKRKRAVVK